MSDFRILGNLVCTLIPGLGWFISFSMLIVCVRYVKLPKHIAQNTEMGKYYLLSAQHIRKTVIQMPRPKKDGRYLNLYLDRVLHDEFEQFCESLGQTKTVAAERAFRMYMDAMKQNPKQIIRESKSPLNKRN